MSFHRLIKFYIQSKYWGATTVLTINVPVVFMALILNGLEGVGPENQDFFGP
jgi:hypothetical protein